MSLDEAIDHDDEQPENLHLEIRRHDQPPPRGELLPNESTTEKMKFGKSCWDGEGLKISCSTKQM
jgi:hypothetical protein